MSGMLEECSCPNNHCFGGNCLCFKAKQFCSPGCTCIGWQNTEENKALVDSQYEVYLKRKAPAVDENLSVPPGGFPAPEGFFGCRCKKTKCMRQCGCLRRLAKSTSNCMCQDCANRGSDTKIVLEQFDANSSMAKEPAQMQEQPTQSGDSSGSGQNKRPQTGRTSSPVFTMSGMLEECSCPSNHCFGGNCLCFKAKQFCSLGCTCIGCQNTEENKDLADSQYKVYLKRKAPAVDENLSVPLGGSPAPEGFFGCRCKKTKCMRQCGCLRRFAKSTSNCTCQDCANRGSDTKIERDQVDGNSSMADEPVQMQEEPTQSGDNSGSGQNKRPRTGHTSTSVFRMSGTLEDQNMGSDQNKQARFKGCRLGPNNIRGALMKLVGMAVLSMLLTMASAGRTEPLTPLRAASSNHEMSAVSGCTPKILARDLVILCRETPTTPMHIEACCGAAVGTVARPRCFCLVKKEPSFGMSPLLNVTNMATMLDRCGASGYLTHSLSTPCDGSSKEESWSSSPEADHTPDSPPPPDLNHSDCPSMERSTCMIYKILSYVGWGVIAVSVPPVAWVIVWRPQATQIIYVPQVQLVELEDKAKEPASRPASSDESTPRNKDDTTASSSDDASEGVLIESKRVRKPNRKFIGDGWDNGTAPPDGPRRQKKKKKKVRN